jgi:hypothetical protein
MVHVVLIDAATGRTIAAKHDLLVVDWCRW